MTEPIDTKPLQDDDINFEAAYERQKLARQQAEEMIESRSRELFEAHEALKSTFQKLKNQNAQLLHQEKLASIGQLAAGVAHEINNPTSFVKSNLGTLQRYSGKLLHVMEAYQGALQEIFEADPERYPNALQLVTDAENTCDIDYITKDISNLVTESLEGTERIQSIVEGLRNFSRPDSNELESLDLHQCLNNTFRLLQNEIKHKAELITDYGDIPALLGHPGSFSQVLLNLVINACHAIDDYGEIRITTSIDDKHVVLSVADNGCGIDAESLPRIFDPFFTTKDVGHGTGLGLSISHGIIKKHQGTLEVSSELGKGSCFTIRLPI